MPISKTSCPQGFQAAALAGEPMFKHLLTAYLPPTVLGEASGRAGLCTNSHLPMQPLAPANRDKQNVVTPCWGTPLPMWRHSETKVKKVTRSAHCLKMKHSETLQKTGLSTKVGSTRPLLQPGQFENCYRQWKSKEKSNAGPCAIAPKFWFSNGIWHYLIRITGKSCFSTLLYNYGWGKVSEYSSN